jgi:hypothetical protein
MQAAAVRAPKILGRCNIFGYGFYFGNKSYKIPTQA